MPSKYTLEERVFLIKTFYRVQNAAETCRQWRREFQSPPPNESTVRDLVKKFEATGSVADASRSGRPVSVRTAELRGRIQESLERSPQKSCRRLSRELGVSFRSVHRSLHDLGYKPFRPRLIHGLLEDDPYQRLEFCETMLERFEADESFIDRIIWTDEAMFKLNGHINRHNCVYWDSDNPLVTIEREVNSPGLMVWAGISSKGIFGPLFFDETCTAASYLALLKDSFWPAFGDQMEEDDMWLMQDGAPAHWARTVREWLDETFPGRWIGRGGAVAWPPRSPDLTPPDFFLWGVLKDRVYEKKPKTIAELKNKIVEEFGKISVELCMKVCRSVPSRLQKCVDVEGLQTELF